MCVVTFQGTISMLPLMDMFLYFFVYIYIIYIDNQINCIVYELCEFSPQKTQSHVFMTVIFIF